MIQNFPLQWPVGYPRCQTPTTCAFKTSLSKAANGIAAELKRFKATDVIISSNLQYRDDGIPYARQTKLDDTGVAVYFKFNDQQRVICCDKWIHVEDNMHAIQLTIQAMRGMDRWGVSEILERIFTGFKALPEGDGVDPYNILKSKKTDSFEVIQTNYRKLVKQFHPDNPHSGNNEKFLQIQNAWNSLTNKIKN